MSIPEHWRYGDSVILRNTGFFSGEVWGTPHRVIEDTDQRVVLFRPEGTDWAIWRIDEQRMHIPSPTRMDMLRLMFPGKPYAVELYFAGDGGEVYSDFAHLEGRFRGWKLNVEAPLVRTEHGFDTTDEVLDIFVEPNGTWHWTDMFEMDYWVRPGAYTEQHREHFFAIAEAVEPVIAAAKAPFDDEFVDWAPPPGMQPALLPPGWELLPGWDIALSTGLRYDEWRAGHEAAHVAGVIAEWREMIRTSRQNPETRRFRTGQRPKA